VVGSSTHRREHDKRIQCQLDHASIAIVWKRHRRIAYRPKRGSRGFLKDSSMIVVSSVPMLRKARRLAMRVVDGEG
jgi:hypothetical protein